ncbi:MFS transporter [Georgenia sp. EYE_87]|uniref:MFS transporter n=1 Tax=Georgenia sp. EYE_87 TaxID=2853448 RepID=UPI002004C8DD|nr:MFS transporter [Georgenia sp. EYE_87]MCK6211476.1 MFS transporter [Georgenia sp. EYE_87]
MSADQEETRSSAARPEPAAPTSRRLPRALRPFLVPRYRFLAGALTLSLLGTGMWIVALVWQVIELDGGPVQLSQVATASAVGMLAAVLVGGVVADRVPQHQILMTVELTKAVLVGAAAALALTGLLELWHLVVVSAVVGATEGFFYPAYSALLPTVLPPEQLLAANGVEGVLRPALMNAAGPAAASVVVAQFSPGLAFAFVSASQVLAATGLHLMGGAPLDRENAEPGHPLAVLATDLREGFRYMTRTPWFMATLLFATAWVLLLIGPIEVLLPFAVRDQAGGGPQEFALVLASFGIGGAVGSLAVASWRMPRRYLTVMVLAWSVGAMPIALIGSTDRLWVMVVAVFVTGLTSGVGQVIWGTLLQRRVPAAMLGRVSSLDFFVSLLLMPVSMALAGPVGEAVGLRPVFLVAGLVPVVFGVAAIVLAHMPRDEIEHPLTVTTEPHAGAAY